jgi:hypothetical protein
LPCWLFDERLQRGERVLFAEVRSAHVGRDRDRYALIWIHQENGASANRIAAVMHVATPVCITRDPPGQTDIGVFPVGIALVEKLWSRSVSFRNPDCRMPVPNRASSSAVDRYPPDGHRSLTSEGAPTASSLLLPRL